jgi:hypothetical protein
MRLSWIQYSLLIFLVGLHSAQADSKILLSRAGRDLELTCIDSHSNSWPRIPGCLLIQSKDGKILAQREISRTAAERLLSDFVTSLGPPLAKPHTQSRTPAHSVGLKWSVSYQGKERSETLAWGLKKFSQTQWAVMKIEAELTGLLP